ncbi:MAG: DUF2937 family protein [Pseudomonadota bacterium]
MMSKSWLLVCAGLGFVTAGQAPEFAQQYKQRLNGGIEELGGVVKRFDQDASEQGLDRDGAIEALNNSSEALPRSRGKSMKIAVDRYDNLLGQQAAMQNAENGMLPVHLIRYPDTKLVQGTYEDYKPAVPVTADGAIWGGIGALLLAIIGRFPVSVNRARRKRKQIKVEEQKGLEELRSNSPNISV